MTIIKKLTAAILSMVIVFFAPPACASVTITKSGNCGDNLTWTLDDMGTLTISGTGDMYDYDINSGNYPGWYKHINLDEELHVYNAIIEEGVTSIGNWAFSWSDLRSISISDTVERIGDYAFDVCYLTEITLPDKLKSIGDYAFCSCYFAEVKLPYSLVSIGAHAFQSGEFSSIYILSNVTYIGENAFSPSYALTEITVSSENSSFISVDGVLYSSDMTKLICYPCKKAGASYSVPDSVTAMSIGVFYGCEELVSVKLPNGLTEIPDYTFVGCYALSEVNVPDGVTSIGERAFYVCTSLVSITLPDSVTALHTAAFQDCDNLKQINLPDGLTEIGNAAFAGCYSLTSLDIPTGITELNAFFNCTSLTSVSLSEGLISIGSFDNTAIQKITIPASVTNILTDVFNRCSNLTEMVFLGDIPESLDRTKHAVYDSLFTGVSGLTVYYPHDNENWASLAEYASGVNLVADLPSAGPQPEVDEAEAQGLLTERTSAGYRSSITRLQFADIVVNMVESALGREISPAKTDTFWDTCDTAILKAYAAGITDGMGDGSFLPGSLATREQIATMLCRAIAYIEEQTGKAYIGMDSIIPENYDDRDSVSSWAYTSVSALVESEIMLGTSDSTLSPKSNTTVQECVLLILRVFELVK